MPEISSTEEMPPGQTEVGDGERSSDGRFGEWLGFIGIIVLILVAIAATVVFVRPSPIETGFLAVLSALTIISQLSVAIIGPGYVVRGWNTQVGSLAPRLPQLIHTYDAVTGLPIGCKRCHLQVRPDRAHHCSVCHRCVLCFDHHCPVLATCIGLRNRKAFLLLLVYSVMLSLVVFEIGARLFITQIIARVYNGVHFIAGVVYLITGLSSCATLLWFAAVHFRYAATAVTTYEHLFPERYTVTVPGPQGPTTKSVFDTGSSRGNMRLVFGSGLLSGCVSFLPFVPPPLRSPYPEAKPGYVWLTPQLDRQREMREEAQVSAVSIQL